MYETTTTSTLTPGQQLLHISEQIEKVNTTLQANTPGTVSFVIDNLRHLAQHTHRLGKQVSKNEDERKDLLALADIGQVVNSSLKLHDVLRIVMDTIIRLTGAERGFLMLKDQDGNLSMRVARNWEQESLEASEFAISRTVIQRVVEEGTPIVTTNAHEDPRFDGQESIIAFNLRSILCVPLKLKDSLTGVIYADNRIRTGIFTQADRNLLSAFANQAAVAIENAQLFESVKGTLAEVTELKNMMDNIFASIASGVITADVEEKIILCNRSAERILGQPADLMVGRCLNDCLPPIASELANYITEVQTTNQPILGIEVAPTLDNRGRVDLIFNLSPLKDANQTTQGIAIVLDDLTEKKRLEAQRQLFERMVPPAVIKQIDLNKIRLGGERAKITTLFADIRGFTSFSESLAPEQLVSILNLYLAAAADAVLAQEGTLDKFMGDAVMAIFNAPISQEDHTLRAVRAAIGIRDAIQKIHSELPPDFQLGFGIGIHYGEAVLGLVGTEKRIDYTAIGDSVNTAKRIQENAAEGQILITKDAYHFVKEFIRAVPVEPIRAKGKKELIEAFEILDLI
ncbi:MAG: GAF domain-containing protein [Anaerolineales bacterium]|nr:GAF domain-containing protein [Anaerolineales bacterium]